ncbi:MAG: aminotransferase class V-fold PLP-dependent enzyme [Acidobacteria bacterium]|nr:aminotransferase class V-fold PLP-dependent enzyme [Acidobacteriota bacterium]
MDIFGLRESLESQKTELSRRSLFQGSGLTALAALGVAVPAEAALEVGPNLYESIGVRPIINAKGTFTIVSGSQSLPEVKMAMMEASKHFVHIDELMDAVGARIAELTQADSAIVTCGCASALTHATAACIAGGDPEKIQRLPDLNGLKSEVVVPNYSRNVYDHAIRAVGVKMITVDSLDAMRRAITDKTAMVTIMAQPADRGEFGLEPVAKVAHEFGIPVLVDAAAEGLTIPNVHLERGADLVAYSGGKAMRGPQTAGLLLGRTDLIRAAWTNSSPHHTFGRAMKVGKEEIMGMLAAVEMWVKRDHDAEFKEWERWLDIIATEVKKVDGVTIEVRQPRGLSNYTPSLRISWDSAKLGVYGEEVERELYAGTPRILLANGSGDRRTGGTSSVGISPWQMMPGNAETIAKALHEKLTTPNVMTKAGDFTFPDAANVDGYWDVTIDYELSPAEHSLVFEQNGETLAGYHRGDRTGGNLSGYVEGNRAVFTSRHRWEGASFGFAFNGTVDGDSMEGEVDLGEYFTAPFKATRHGYGQGGGRG